MGFAVLVVLTLVWALGLLPGILRTHRVQSAEHTITAFHRSLAILAPHQQQAGRRVMVLDDPASVAGRSRRARMRHRRRQAVQNLGVATACVMAVALLLGGPFWGVALVVALAYLGFLLALREVQQREQVRRRTVLRVAAGPGVGAPRGDGEWSLTQRRVG